MASRSSREAHQRLEAAFRLVEEATAEFEAAVAEADPEVASAASDDFTVMRRHIRRAAVEVERAESMRLLATPTVRRGPRARGAGRPARRRTCRSSSTRGDPDLGNEPPGRRPAALVGVVG
jgi:hypothetical protein